MDQILKIHQQFLPPYLPLALVPLRQDKKTKIQKAPPPA